MNTAVKVIGFTALTAVMISGTIVGVSLLHEKGAETELLPVSPWHMITSEQFDKLEEDCDDYELCYFTLYSDNSAMIDYPQREGEGCCKYISADKLHLQSYVPAEYLEHGGYFVNNENKTAWSIVRVSYECFGGFTKEVETDD